MAGNLLNKDVVSGLFFENLITKRQLSERLNLSISYIDKLMRKGMPRVKLGRAVRFKFNVVMAWLLKTRSLS